MSFGGSPLNDYRESKTWKLSALRQQTPSSRYTQSYKRTRASQRRHKRQHDVPEQCELANPCFRLLKRGWCGPHEGYVSRESRSDVAARGDQDPTGVPLFHSGVHSPSRKQHAPVRASPAFSALLWTYPALEHTRLPVFSMMCLLHDCSQGKTRRPGTHNYDFFKLQRCAHDHQIRIVSSFICHRFYIFPSST